LLRAANLPVYIAESSIELQLAALGAPAMQKILALGKKEGELDEAEKIYIIETLQKAMRKPSREGTNGAKAALNVVKHL
jgi:hypothetical protein